LSFLSSTNTAIAGIYTSSSSDSEDDLGGVGGFSGVSSSGSGGVSSGEGIYSSDSLSDSDS
jgi:hypothetical protein